MAKAKRSADKAQAYRKSFNLAALAAVILAILCTVGGTLAWIVSVPDPVVNTFTYGEIEITLEETDSPIDEENDPEDQNTYMMAPGIEIDKDPTVTVKAGSEACYVFVRIDESNNTFGTDKYIQYSVNSAWQPLDGQTGVYYLEQSALSETDTDAVYSVLAGDDTSVANGAKGMVTINSKILASTFTSVAAEDLPKLTFTAYAIQADGFTSAEAAWTEASK